MNIEERKKIARKIFIHLNDTMGNFYFRWQDEKEYEDIMDYQQALAPEILKFGGKIIKMTKRPFGVQFRLGDGIYHLMHTSETYSYKLIAIISK